MRRIARFGCLWGPLFAATLAAAAARADEPITLRGQVLLPDGAPAAGTELYWLEFKAISPKVYEGISLEKRTIADDQGRFEFSFMQDGPREELARWLIAYLPGYGVDWLKIIRDQAPGEAVLRLVADKPIRGRVIDTEGRHVAGATIAVRTIAASPTGTVDELLKGKANYWNGRMGHGGHSLPLLTAVTDREGRFELSGIGAERLASVNISAPGLASEDVEVVNRDGFDAKQYGQVALAGRNSSRLVGPVFEHVAEADLVIRGIVVAGADRKPVARSYVSWYGFGRYSTVFVQTDELGRFELRGVPRGTERGLDVASPPTGNLLRRSIALDLAVGQTEVETEVELKEGIAIEGRVFDKATLQGVERELRYASLPDNVYVDQPGYASFVRTRTDEKGRFQILVSPGPAVLMAQVSVNGVVPQSKVVTPYRQASFSEEDAKKVPIVDVNGPRYFVSKGGRQYLFLVNAAKFLNPPPGSGPVTCDLGLETGKAIKLAIEDEQGRPVSGALVDGMADSMNRTRHIAETSCDIVGLGADRPRRVGIVQPERHLAGSLTLTGDEPAQVSLRLSATASITGRALDASGEPLAGATVQIRYEHGAVLYEKQWEITTDGDGKFHEDNVLPAEPFELDFIKGRKFFRVPGITGKKRRLQPGEKLELGEFKTKEVQ